MHKVILLGASNRWSMINGVVILLVSILNFRLSWDDGPVFQGLTLALLIGATIYLIFMVLSSVKLSKFAVKVTINEEDINFKTTFFGKPQQIRWADIKDITFKPYQIIFHQHEGKTDVSYDTLASISVDIKGSIRQIAEKKGIPVTGG